MSELEKLNMPDSVVEKLRCSFCNGYLSCAPIQLLANGRSVCGHCSPSTHDGPTYRQIAFEAILTETSFPCQFKESGCEKRVLFGHIAEHEDSCLYRPFLCPSLPNGACSWEGSMNQISDHFKHDHPTLVMEKIEFKFEVDHDGQGILLAIVDDAVFISKFVYNADKRTLHYDIRSLGANINEAHYKVKLINTIVCDYSVNLKGDNCFPYNNFFYGMDNATDLNIGNFLPILDNPNEITFAIDVVVTKPDNEKNIEEQVCGSEPDVNLNNAQITEQDSSKPASPCSGQYYTFVGTPEEIPKHEMGQLAISGRQRRRSVLRQQTCAPAGNTNTTIDQNILIQAISNDSFVVEKSGQWLLSCYGPFKEKPNYPGFEEKSFEEIRWRYYEAQGSTRTINLVKLQFQKSLLAARIKLMSLQHPSQEDVNTLQRIYNSSPETSKYVFTNSAAPLNFNSPSTNVFANNQNTLFSNTDLNNVFGQNSNFRNAM